MNSKKTEGDEDQKGGEKKDRSRGIIPSTGPSRKDCGINGKGRERGTTLRSLIEEKKLGTSAGNFRNSSSPYRTRAGYTW